ncbi:MAG: hypothetical protein ACUVT1_06585 [Anaerolineae bacterium]
MLKLGFHVNRVSEEVFQAILKVRPPVIKTLDHDVGFWRRVREAFPEAFIIGRLYEPNQVFMPDPEERGRAFAERVLSIEANRYKLFNAWESFNECLAHSSSPEEYDAYDRFQVAFGERIKAAGMEPIAMNFGTGQYLGEDWLKHFPRTLQFYTYLGFHEYDWPTMRRLHEEGVKAGNGGMWLALRYRRIMEPIRQAMGPKHIAVITECGLTQGVYPGRPDVGWRTGVSEEQYWESLRWYNDELAKDDYVLGAAIFVVGAVAPWHSFESLGGIIDRLAGLTAKPASYRSHYVLFPQGTPWAWYDACRHYFLRFRCTRGESPDDAAKVHGDLGHTITCINPSEEVLAYLRRLNPTAEIDRIDVESVAELFAIMKWRADNNRRFG